MIDSTRPTGRRESSRHRKLLEDFKRQTGQLAAINTVTAAVSQTLDLNETLQTALAAVLSVIPVEASGISMVDEVAGELVLRAQRGWKRDFVTDPMRIKLGEGISGRAAVNDELVITGDVAGDPRLFVPAFGEEHVQAQVLAPMHARGKVVGILSVMSYKPYAFDENEVAVLRAIADQVGLALDNARLYESVREQERRLQAVLQSTADAIIATDRHGQINLINRAAQALFQVNVQAVIGSSLKDAPFSPALSRKLHEALDSDSNSGVSFEVELETGHHLAAVVSPVRSERNPSEGWVAVFQDITHLKEAERTRMQFIQTAAHDLRNPLAVTLGALTMLRRQIEEPTPRQSEVFDIALNGVNRMQDLIDDLLNLEHIESGVDLHDEPLDLRELIERCSTDMGPVLPRREQTLNVEIDPELPFINGDERWLYRALINLLSNAHKYTQRGGTITVRATCRNQEVFIEVVDNGPGIPLEAQARLFERFY
ncbi:MAG TPA: GAF domain-containing protein, partial [Aggregatilineales bacterium]|nr:GAF domain-containing protein [Aggregatilineales bacterium]